MSPIGGTKRSCGAVTACLLSGAKRRHLLGMSISHFDSYRTSRFWMDGRNHVAKYRFALRTYAIGRLIRG
jgi:hypothetical protein